MSWLSYSSLIPPNLFILLTGIGLVLAWRRTRSALSSRRSGAPYFTWPRRRSYPSMLLPASYPVCPPMRPAGAIIVLAADFRHGQRFTVGPLTLERLAEAARQERRLGPPVLVSGGKPGFPSRNDERGARGPFAEYLRERRFLGRHPAARRRAVCLVTHSLDMTRALWSFRAIGYPVIPAAPRQQTIGQRRNDDEAPSVLLSSFFPQIPALLVSYNALHEIIGLGWYLYRYGDREVRPSATVGIPG